MFHSWEKMLHIPVCFFMVFLSGVLLNGMFYSPDMSPCVVFLCFRRVERPHLLIYGFLSLVKV